MPTNTVLATHVGRTLMSPSEIWRVPMRSQPAEGRKSTSTFGTHTGRTHTTSLARRNAACTSMKVARMNRPEIWIFFEGVQFWREVAV